VTTNHRGNAQYLPEPWSAPQPWNQGEAEAKERGNPYDWNTPAHDHWNEGYYAAMASALAIITRKAKK